ncbi:hypothetical protein P7K49_030501 [Saguinus oedipus]|uniref:Uncharacterized protein n=1 Tax=Saguinus oedipus TaxID=9490 RepID=A0ABQ9U2B9_SAGOE|nr:hypothetical protein P7K49_030501 [Saguinus oedipus]
MDSKAETVRDHVRDGCTIGAQRQGTLSKAVAQQHPPKAGQQRAQCLSCCCPAEVARPPDSLPSMLLALRALLSQACGILAFPAGPGYSQTL